MKGGEYVNIGIEIHGIKHVCDELKNIIALADELKSRVDKIKDYCTSVGIEMREYDGEFTEAFKPKPVENSIEQAAQKAEFCNLYEKVRI